ncbi:hypothetical protein G7K_6035-t1 [Saitoella complicata NRRL Y-17804]|uniref:Mitochondrial intermembrane space import and assembly protein 40 n=2 Tax=Saitoella complicata (strain BCRC 22490 / CBS 7301 / JCM 7358 / NBRC 10748 / NRRL Y-17804) TaxID=698492 RepID=A0A0E9NQ05_SAICN|nr:hypothetical protein G7K_6035-t1 [Saitoella complicata NRRL Y-17804]
MFRSSARIIASRRVAQSTSRRTFASAYASETASGSIIRVATTAFVAGALTYISSTLSSPIHLEDQGKAHVDPPYTKAPAASAEKKRQDSTDTKTKDGENRAQEGGPQVVRSGHEEQGKGHEETRAHGEIHDSAPTASAEKKKQAEKGSGIPADAARKENTPAGKESGPKKESGHSGDEASAQGPTGHDDAKEKADSKKAEKKASKDDKKEDKKEGEDSSQQGAFNEETGEINWDCPCLGGMAHGPCGPEFREAFSCFVYSKEEPKGMECVDKFRGMQECFRKHPEIYGEEIADDEEMPEPEQAAKEASPVGKEELKKAEEKGELFDDHKKEEKKE